MSGENDQDVINNQNADEVRILVTLYPLKSRVTCWIIPIRHPGDSGAGVGSGIGGGVGCGSGSGPGSTASASNNLRSLLASEPSS